MKYLYQSYLSISMLFVASLIHARPFEEQTMQWSMGPLFNYAEYRLGCVPKLQGYLAGIHTDLIYSNDWYTELRLDSRFNTTLMCGALDTRSKVRDVNPAWYVGYNCNPEDCYDLLFRPITGVSFTYLSHQLQPNISTYKYFIIDVPVGLHALWDVCPDEFFMGIKAEYRINVYRQLKLSTPCLTIGEKIGLKRGHAFNIEVPLAWQRTTHHERANFILKVVPLFRWIEYGKADQTNTNCLPYEIPRLRQWHLGLHLDFGITF